MRCLVTADRKTKVSEGWNLSLCNDWIVVARCDCEVEGNREESCVEEGTQVK